MPNTSTRARPPEPHEIEVSIFGPGKGESVLVHTGAGEWVVVDSCIDQVERHHPVIAYLKDIGVDLSTAVKLVVATHAHDDHIKGIADLFREASSADLSTSHAIVSEEFFARVEADETIEKQFRQTIRSEYRDLFDQIEEGNRRLKRAHEERILWERKGGSPARVVALSPSDKAVTRALDFLSRGTAQPGDRKRLAAADPNEFAIGLWVETAHASVLLGADLTIGPDGCGWKAVMDWFDPDEPASYVKVPHHGSPTSHHPPVWDKLLTERPVATIAPYRAGVKPLPSPEDINRILSLTPEAYITANPAAIAPSRHVKKTRSRLGGVGKNFRDPWGRAGQVRARKLPNETSWRVETIRPASRLVP